MGSGSDGMLICTSRRGLARDADDEGSEDRDRDEAARGAGMQQPPGGVVGITPLALTHPRPHCRAPLPNDSLVPLI